MNTPQIQLPTHGGQVQAIMRNFSGAPEPFVDLSTGISPYPYPFSLPAPSILTRLPEQDEEQALLADAARAYGLTSTTLLAAGAGTQLLISLLPYVLRGDHATILGPTYNGHATAWQHAGVSLQVTSDMESMMALAPRPGHVMIVCNPNNPDGRRYSPDILRTLADHCANHGGYLVIDEAYVDFEPSLSLALALPHPGLCILRSFGKSYGLPGIRLGFFLASAPLVKRMSHMLGDWPVSIPAIHAGRAALSDPLWLKQQSDRLERDIRQLVHILQTIDLPVVGQTKLFVLVRTAQAPALWCWLCQHGIITRIFPDQPTDIRFGLPANANDWTRLEHALLSWAAEGKTTDCSANMPFSLLDKTYQREGTQHSTL